MSESSWGALACASRPTTSATSSLPSSNVAIWSRRRGETSYLWPAFVAAASAKRPGIRGNLAENKRYGERHESRHASSGSGNSAGSTRQRRPHDGLERLREKRPLVQAVTASRHCSSPFCLHNFSIISKQPQIAIGRYSPRAGNLRCGLHARQIDLVHQHVAWAGQNHAALCTDE